MAAQQFKSFSIRQLVNNVLAGKPIDVPTRELFDLPDGIDVDSDNFVDTEYCDKCEILQYAIELKESSNTKKKGGIENETPPPQDETPPPLQTE